MCSYAPIHLYIIFSSYTLMKNEIHYFETLYVFGLSTKVTYARVVYKILV